MKCDLAKEFENLETPEKKQNHRSTEQCDFVMHLREEQQLNAFDSICMNFKEN
jgi:hypothetical protein